MDHCTLAEAAGRLAVTDGGLEEPVHYVAFPGLSGVLTGQTDHVFLLAFGDR